MKLSDYAKKNGISYGTARNHHHAGILPGSKQLPNGTIIVDTDLARQIESKIPLIKEQEKAKEYSAEEIRKLIDPAASINALADILVQADTVDLMDLPRLRLKMDIHIAMLKKTIPDLKALEIKERKQTKARLVIEHATLAAETDYDKKKRLNKDG